jgi:hypothetical protein
MRNTKSTKIFVIFSTTFLACSILSAPGANAAYTVLPKVGQCFQYTMAQVSAKYATKNPVSCSSTHNMETFKVATWPLRTNPVDMEDEDKLSIVSEYCDFWGTFRMQNLTDQVRQTLITGLGTHLVVPPGLKVNVGYVAMQ